MLIYNAAAAGWHSDETWREETPLGSVLYGRSVPEYGGDTVFADMERVYDDLSDDMQENLDGLYAVHDHISHRRRMRAIGKSEEQIDAWRREYPEVRHPIVRTHPVTGRKSLFVNGGFTARVDGMDADESKELLASLYALVAKPQYQCRFRWQTRSVAFWDNRSVQHYGVPDFGDQERLMERVTIGGDRPA
jgi:taurine dioxygenase